MKKRIRVFLLISILTALLTACDYYLKPAKSDQETEVQTTQVTQAQTTAEKQEPQYTDGELTQKLGKELNELFESETYYFKETTDITMMKDRDFDLVFHVTIKDGNNYCLIDTTSVNGELQVGEKYIRIDNAVYSIDDINDTEKQIHRWTDNISMFDAMFDSDKYSYLNILPPIVKYISTSIAKENGIQLTCETYEEDDDRSINYYYEGEKLNRYEHMYKGTVVHSTTIEYSKEIDKSLFELPKDYEIMDVDDGL